METPATPKKYSPRRASTVTTPRKRPLSGRNAFTRSESSRGESTPFTRRSTPARLQPTRKYSPAKVRTTSPEKVRSKVRTSPEEESSFIMKSASEVMVKGSKLFYSVFNDPASLFLKSVPKRVVWDRNVDQVAVLKSFMNRLPDARFDDADPKEMEKCIFVGEAVELAKLKKLAKRSMYSLCIPDTTCTKKVCFSVSELYALVKRTDAESEKRLPLPLLEDIRKAVGPDLAPHVSETIDDDWADSIRLFYHYGHLNEQIHSTSIFGNVMTAMTSYARLHPGFLAIGTFFNKGVNVLPTFFQKIVRSPMRLVHYVQENKTMVWLGSVITLCISTMFCIFTMPSDQVELVATGLSLFVVEAKLPKVAAFFVQCLIVFAKCWIQSSGAGGGMFLGWASYVKCCVAQVVVIGNMIPRSAFMNWVISFVSNMLNHLGRIMSRLPSSLTYHAKIVAHCYNKGSGFFGCLFQYAQSLVKSPKLVNTGIFLLFLYWSKKEVVNFLARCFGDENPAIVELKRVWNEFAKWKEQNPEEESELTLFDVLLVVVTPYLGIALATYKNGFGFVVSRSKMMFIQFMAGFLPYETNWIIFNFIAYLFNLAADVTKCYTAWSEDKKEMPTFDAKMSKDEIEVYQTKRVEHLYQNQTSVDCCYAPLKQFLLSTNWNK